MTIIARHKLLKLMSSEEKKLRIGSEDIREVYFNLQDTS